MSLATLIPMDAGVKNDEKRVFEQAKRHSNETLDQLAKDFPGISAAVYKGSNAVWSSARGAANLDQAIPATGDTVYNIYSTSKALTGFAFACLERDGKVGLNQTAGELATDLPETFHPIRIRDLLSHTSGIRHYSSRMDWLGFAQRECETPLEAIQYFADDPLVSEPGSNFHYSTFAFVVASELLLRVTGEKRFDVALNSSLGSWADFQLDHPSANKAKMYIQAGRLPRPPGGISSEAIVPLPPMSAACKYGGGGLIASSKQLARAGAALYQGEIIPLANLDTALLPWTEVNRVVYGAAVNNHEGSDGQYRSYSLSGGAPGGRSYLLVLIEPQISVAIAANREGPNLSNSAWKIAKAWLGAEY